MYLNALICLLISAFTFYTSIYILKSGINNLADKSFGFFWLFSSFTWLFVCISLILYKNGFEQMDIYVNQYLVQSAIFLQIAIGSYFGAFRATRRKSWSIALCLLTILISFIGLYFAYQPGSLYPIKNTFISVEYQINDKTWTIFQVLFSLIIICTSIDFIRNLYYWFRRSSLFEEKYFFACMSALIYAMVGYFDQRGVSASWIAVLFRSTLIICASIAYLAYSDKEV